MATCVVIHGAGITWALRRLRRQPTRWEQFWAATWIGVRLAIWMVVCHLVEIGVWAVVYAWSGAMPDSQSALYFSAVTYTTTGYGDLVLSSDWRMIAGIEALTGILMCGWSTAFFFAAISRMHQADAQTGR